jgi:hypothetical protein
MVAPEVRVYGLPELVRALKQVDSALPKELRKTSLDVAKMVTEKARSRGYGLGSVAAKAAPSLRAAARGGGAGVTLGGGAYPFAPGAEFGGGRRPTTQQFKPWRGSGSGAGYFVWPTIRDNSEQIEQDWTEGVEDLFKKAGLL